MSSVGCEGGGATLFTPSSSCISFTSVDESLDKSLDESLDESLLHEKNLKLTRFNELK